MTLRSFGQIVPIQVGMLMLSGYGRTPEDGVRDLVKMADDPEILAALVEGRRILKKVTDQDFGYSLRAWHDFLLSDEKEAKSYTRQTSWRGVERVVLAELQNPDRARLEELAEQQI